jgi:hypothetical protein
MTIRKNIQPIEKEYNTIKRLVQNPLFSKPFVKMEKVLVWSGKNLYIKLKGHITNNE